MKIEESKKIPGVLLLTPEIFRDPRGYFLETHRTGPLNEFRSTDGGHGGIRQHISFVQGNVSSSVANCIRGLHYQLERPQGKLVRCLRGKIYDVAVDIRKGSPTFGKWVGFHIDDQLQQAVYVPPGFAHGFLSGGTGALVHYECTTEYVDAWNRAIRWDDPELNIGWGIPRGQVPVLSTKDRAAATFGQAIEKGDIFDYLAPPAELIEPESRISTKDLAETRRVPRHDVA